MSLAGSRLCGHNGAYRQCPTSVQVTLCVLGTTNNEGLVAVFVLAGFGANQA